MLAPAIGCVSGCSARAAKLRVRYNKEHVPPAPAPSAGVALSRLARAQQPHHHAQADGRAPLAATRPRRPARCAAAPPPHALNRAPRRRPRLRPRAAAAAADRCDAPLPCLAVGCTLLRACRAAGAAAGGCWRAHCQRGRGRSRLLCSRAPVPRGHPARKPRPPAPTPQRRRQRQRRRAAAAGRGRRGGLQRRGAAAAQGARGARPRRRGARARERRRRRQRRQLWRECGGGRGRGGCCARRRQTRRVRGTVAVLASPGAVLRPPPCQALTPPQPPATLPSSACEVLQCRRALGPGVPRLGR